MKTPWTKGPWTVTKNDPPGFIGIDGASFKVRKPIYATDLTYEDGVQRTADAHLMSASPEMADALIAFVSHYPMGINLELDAAYRDARAALEKAGWKP